MRLRNIFIAVFVMFFYIVNSQTKTQFTNLKNAVEPITFKPLTIDLTKITSLEMLSNIWVSEKVDEDYKTKILPEKFNWNLDAFRIDSYKRMVLDFNKHDRYGRDLLRNINQDLINQIYFKDNKYGY